MTTEACRRASVTSIPLFQAAAFNRTFTPALTAALADAGYRAVAPFLRGYSPTEVPTNGFYGIATLATDIAEIIRTIGNGKPVNLVGQDWGAIIGYAVIAAYPELVQRAVIAAVPHSGQVKKSMLDVRHIQRSFHWWFFQMAELPEKAIVENDFAFIDYLLKSKHPRIWIYT